jgi:hypothetical protein
MPSVMGIEVGQGFGMEAIVISLRVTFAFLPYTYGIVDRVPVSSVPSVLPLHST